MKELIKDLGETPLVTINPISEFDFYNFEAAIEGPVDSPYEGGVFKLKVQLLPEYPMVAPKINFVTKIYHPNIDEQGCICLDVFMKLWTPAMQFKKTLLSVYLLL
jgi:ubiquitin-protein ligase